MMLLMNNKCHKKGGNATGKSSRLLFRLLGWTGALNVASMRRTVPPQAEPHFAE
jgi:hypothetical protein